MTTRLAKQVGKALKSRGIVLATAESCTGGGISFTITKVAGSSEWFDRGFVTYSNTSKEEMLGVSPHTMKNHGAVSETTAREMAEGALQYSRAQITLAVTGVAGPTGGTPEKPVGLVWFAWVSKGKAKTVCHHFTGDRDAIRVKATRIALQGVLDLLNSQPQKTSK
jgi:nicotinamide-nucleotide amidase